MLTSLSGLWFAGALVFASGGRPESPTNLDFYVGPVLGSSRVVGMGGASVGLAEGAEGQAGNPAAISTRYAWANELVFDYDWALTTMQDFRRDGLELDLSGRSTRGFELHDGAYQLKWGPWGLGLRVESQMYRYALTRARNGGLEPVRFRQQVFGLGLARQLFRGGLHVGMNLNLARAGIYDCDLGVSSCAWHEEVDMVTIRGAGGQMGLLLSPVGSNYRVGLSYRSRILAFQLGGERARFLQDELPDALMIPGQLSVGGTWFWGQRSFNLASGAERFSGAKDGSVDRRYGLISVEFLITQGTPDGFGTLAFLEGEAQRAGERPVLSPRLGLEAEVLNNRLVLRAGSYFEPSRFRDSRHGAGRWHGTAGADLRVHLLWDWKLSAHADVASAYRNVGVGLGLWH